MRAAVGIAALLLAAAAAAIAANVALLGYTDHRNDPIGRLSPRAMLVTGSAPALRPAPSAPVPTHDREDD